MKTLLIRLNEFQRSEAGPTATEYAVLLGVISIGVIGAMGLFGQHMNNLYVMLSSTTSVF